eukprot:6065538-Pleurochrysis_carterae.AAC.1
MPPPIERMLTHKVLVYALHSTLMALNKSNASTDALCGIKFRQFCIDHRLEMKFPTRRQTNF